MKRRQRKRERKTGLEKVLKKGLAIQRKGMSFRESPEHENDKGDCRLWGRKD